jgi:sugar phosphate isomerase/epimerase
MNIRESDMLIGCVTDEISQNYIEAINTGMKEGIYHYELRSIDGNRFPFFTRAYMELLKESAKKHSIKYTAVSPGIFKLNKKTILSAHISKEFWEDIFNKTIELEAKRVIIFARERFISKKEYNKMIEDINLFAQLASGFGITVCIENSPSTCCCTSKEIFKLIKDVGHENLKINWDPGNSACCGEIDFREGFQMIYKHIDNVHIKDIKFDDSNNPVYVPAGDGCIDYKSLLSDLIKAEYKGIISIEHHCKPVVANFIKSLTHIRSVLP